MFPNYSCPWCVRTLCASPLWSVFISERSFSSILLLENSERQGRKWPCRQIPDVQNFQPRNFMWWQPGSSEGFDNESLKIFGHKYHMHTMSAFTSGVDAKLFYSLHLRKKKRFSPAMLRQNFIRFNRKTNSFPHLPTLLFLKLAAYYVMRIEFRNASSPSGF